MAGGGGSQGSRELDQTPTWAVALVCAVIVLISIILEKVLHAVGHAMQRRKKVALVEALEKIKGELMVLGFISLLLTFGQNYIAKICIPEEVGNTMLPCEDQHSDLVEDDDHHRRRLLWHERRFLAADKTATDCKKGYVPLISLNGLHQLHIFIFFLAVFHVFYSAVTMTLGRMKIRRWKEWEKRHEAEYDKHNDPSRFRLTHETSFVRGHTSSWMSIPVVFYFVCFFEHILYSVREPDYLTLRHGFVTVHLVPGTRFNFQKYIKRSLEDDFKVVVGIPPFLWFTTVLYLLMNVNGWHAMFWLSIMPLLIILAVGTKLQSIIARMAIEIKERHAVVQGIPLVQVSDNHFWFHNPTFLLYLIHLTLFQNAFEITYFLWITYEFGLDSCFQDVPTIAFIRVALGIGVQFLCSYITLPLYALVTQMGSHMKRSIFDEQTSKALTSWADKAKKKQVNPGQAQKPKTRKLGGSPGDSPDDSPRTHQQHAGGSYNDPESGLEMGQRKSISPRETDNLTAGVEDKPAAANRDLLTGL